MTYNRARVGVHAAVSNDRNRARLARIQRKYARYDREHPERWFARVWCALWLGWTMTREALR